MNKVKKIVITFLFFPGMVHACAGDNTGLSNPTTSAILAGVTIIIFIFVQKMKKSKLKSILNIVFAILTAFTWLIFCFNFFIAPHLLCGSAKF